MVLETSRLILLVVVPNSSEISVIVGRRRTCTEMAADVLGLPAYS